MRILDQIFTVYSPLTVSSLPHWSLVCAASRLPATVVAKVSSLLLMETLGNLATVGSCYCAVVEYSN